MIRKFTFLGAILSASFSFGQGFATSATNWTVPTGGQVSSTGIGLGFNETASALNYYNWDQGWTTMDIDGDGDADLVVTGVGDGSYGKVWGYGTSPYWKVYLNNGTSFSTTATNWTVPTGGEVTSTGIGNGFNTTSSALNYYNWDQGWTTMDINGDGMPDLVVTGVGDGSYGKVWGYGTSPYWKVYLNTGAGFSTTATNWTVPTGGEVTSTGIGNGFNESASSLNYYNWDQGWTTMDINGDNLPDLVVTGVGDGSYGKVWGYGASPYWKVYLNTGSGFATTATNWAVPTGGEVTSTGIGNGFNEAASALNYYNWDQGWVTSDINGDGLADLVVTGVGDGSYGKVWGYGTSPYWKVYINSGSGFSTTATNWAVPTGGEVTSTGIGNGFNAYSSALNYYNWDQGWSTADIDNDGMPDLVVTGVGDGSYGEVWGMGSSPYWKVYFNNGNGFATGATNWTVPNGGEVTSTGIGTGFNAWSSTLNYYNWDQGWSTMDIDGDGDADLVATGVGDGSYGAVWGNGSSPYWKVYLNQTTGLGVSENQLEDQLLVYPNPTKGDLNLDFTSMTDVKNVKVIDLMGKTVLSIDFDKMNQKNISINLSSVNAGTYIMMVHTDNSIIQKRIIKK